MASQVPPKRGEAYTFEVALVDQSDTDVFKTSPTLAAGDVKISKDGGALSNIGSLPTEIGTTGILTVSLTAAEMTADRVSVLFHDAVGDEWQDLLVTIQTVTTSQIDDLATADDVWDEVVEGSFTARQFLRLLGAVMAGKASGGATTTITFTGLDDATNRVVMTVDSKGNRSSVSRDAT